MCHCFAIARAERLAQEYFQVARAVELKVGEDSFYVLLEMVAPRATRQVRNVHLVQTFRVPELVAAAMNLEGHSI